MSTVADASTQEGQAHSAQEQGRHTEAEALLRAVLSERVNTLGLDSHHPDVIRAKNNLAASLNAQYKDLPYAESLQLEVVTADRERLGSEHPDTISSLNNLAEIYAHQGRYSKATELQREAVTLSENAHGPTHRETFAYKENLANILTRHEQFLARDSNDLTILTPAIDGKYVDVARQHLAATLSRAGKYDEAESIYRNLIAGPETPGLAKAAAMASLAKVLRSRGQLSQAEAMYKEALGQAQGVMSTFEEQVHGIEQALGEVQGEIKRPTQAQA